MTNGTNIDLLHELYPIERKPPAYGSLTGDNLWAQGVELATVDISDLLGDTSHGFGRSRCGIVYCSWHACGYIVVWFVVLNELSRVINCWVGWILLIWAGCCIDDIWMIVDWWGWWVGIQAMRLPVYIVCNKNESCRQSVVVVTRVIHYPLDTFVLHLIL